MVYFGPSPPCGVACCFVNDNSCEDEVFSKVWTYPVDVLIWNFNITGFAVHATIKEVSQDVLT
jgi:hypothetical protein